jgi:hypothetical protein
LDEFGKKYMTESVCITLNGFSPYIHVRELLALIFHSTLKDCVGGSVVPPGSDLDSARSFGQLLSQHGKRVYLVIHNLDLWLETEGNVWSVLMELSSKNSVHIVASVESSLVSLKIRQGLKAHVFVEVHTYLPYEAEFVEDRRHRESQSNAVSVAGAIKTLEALHDHTKDMYLHLISFSLENPRERKSVDVFMEECRTNYWASSRPSFDPKIQELLSHRLLKLERDSAGKHVISLIPSEDSLREIMDHFNQPNTLER